MKFFQNILYFLSKLQNDIIDYFDREKIDFLLPEEILENFKLVVNENKLEECENNAYSKLSSYLMTGRWDETVIFENVNQIYFPDRELKTPLHRLFALKKIEILHKLHKKELESKSKNYDKVLTQLEYIYDYHFKY